MIFTRFIYGRAIGCSYILPEKKKKKSFFLGKIFMQKYRDTVQVLLTVAIILYLWSIIIIQVLEHSWQTGSDESLSLLFRSSGKERKFTYCNTFWARGISYKMSFVPIAATHGLLPFSSTRKRREEKREAGEYHVVVHVSRAVREATLG